jgi:hypothetical protein
MILFTTSSSSKRERSFGDKSFKAANSNPSWQKICQACQNDYGWLILHLIMTFTSSIYFLINFRVSS